MHHLPSTSLMTKAGKFALPYEGWVWEGRGRWDEMLGRGGEGGPWMKQPGEGGGDWRGHIVRSSGLVGFAWAT